MCFSGVVQAIRLIAVRASCWRTADVRWADINDRWLKHIRPLHSTHVGYLSSSSQPPPSQRLIYYTVEMYICEFFYGLDGGASILLNCGDYFVKLGGSCMPLLICGCNVADLVACITRTLYEYRTLSFSVTTDIICEWMCDIWLFVINQKALVIMSFYLHWGMWYLTTFCRAS